MVNRWEELLQPMMSILSEKESKAFSLFQSREGKPGRTGTSSFKKFGLPDCYTTYVLLVASARFKMQEWLWCNYGIEKIDDLEFDLPRTSSDGRYCQNAAMQTVREVEILPEHQRVTKKNLTTNKNRSKA